MAAQPVPGPSPASPAPARAPFPAVPPTRNGGPTELPPSSVSAASPSGISSPGGGAAPVSRRAPIVPDDWDNVAIDADDRFDVLSLSQCGYCRTHVTHSPMMHAEEVERTRAEVRP